MRRFIKSIFWIILVFFLARVFVFQSYKVENFAMSSTLIPGDRLLVNKLAPGARFPMSIIGLPGADRGYVDFFRIPYFRLPGYRSFERNNVVIYNDPRIADTPVDRKPLKISRIVGIPGDTVIILDKELYINRVKIPAPHSYRKEYRIVTTGEPVPLGFLSEFQIEPPDTIADIGIYDYYLDSIAYEAIQELPMVKNIRLRKQFIGDSSSDFFPFSSFFHWNRDQVGPLIVPVKGLTIDLNIRNIDLYSRIIDIYEKNDLLVDFSGVTINGEKAKSYTFKGNYYFVLNDNRDNPDDWRKVGFIPESHLLGTSRRIFYSGKSNYPYLGNFNLKRTLKKIDK